MIFVRKILLTLDSVLIMEAQRRKFDFSLAAKVKVLKCLTKNNGDCDQKQLSNFPL